MKLKPPDDIGVLCNHTGLDRATYRVFTGPKQPAARLIQDAPRPETSRRAAPHAGLERAFGNIAVKDAAPARMQLFSSSGGAGATTVAASVARAFSLSGECVAVVDGCSLSAVPLYFGGRTLRGGQCTFLPAGESATGPVHLVARDEGAAGAEWWQRSLKRLEGEVNRILVDSPEHEAGGLTLLLVVPDLAAILRARHFAAHAAEPPFVLLNKFDPTVPLHVEVRTMLAAQFGERLLPFALRRSDEYSEALAEGVTVLEYAPRGMAAEDIRRLAGWLRNAR